MPQFQSGGGYNAIQEFLLQREAQQRQAMLDQILQQQQAEQSAMREREMALREQEANDRRTRLAQQDATAQEAAAKAERDRTNTIGVRGMMADAMTQGPLTPDSAKTIGIMAFREGMEAPPEVQQMQSAESEAQKRSAGLADYEARQMIDASLEPEQESDRYISAGGSIFDKETRGFMTPPQGGADARQAGAQDAASAYGVQTADRTIAAIDDVLPKISNWTAGAGGRVLGMIPGTEAANVSAELQTIAGNIAFNALQQMRAASKTGGALGSIAQQELQMLQSVEGSLRQSQSPENLKMQLAKVRESMERFKAAQGQQPAAPSAGSSSFRVIGVR